MTQRSLYNFIRGVKGDFRRGATLVEMMVSIAITIGMLAAAGIVYKSAGDASGQAMANSVIMERYRSLTSQLERDFTGLRPDMPMAIIFESQVDPRNGQLYRYDRIVFFAAGDFQVGDYGTTNTVSANLARIFYGQSIDVPPTPAHALIPPRRILARKCNLISSNIKYWVNFWTDYNATGRPKDAGYDFYPIDYAISLADWKNMPFDDTSSTNDFMGMYFLDYPPTVPANYPLSIIRRPNLDGVVINTGYEGLNRLYFLPDITDFKIQLWYDNGPVAGRWFPDVWDMQTAPFDTKFAFFWNVFDPTNVLIAPQTIDTSGINWWAEKGLKNLANFSPFGWTAAWQSTWPKAIKFTFTLYDKTRHHYPQGRTFSYIINLPPRY